MPLEIIAKEKAKKTPHLAMTHMELQQGAANGRNVSLLMKSSDELSEEVKKALVNLGYNIEKMFMSSKSALLTAAIKAKFSDDEDDWVYVEDFDDTTAIFCMECCLYSIKYTISGDTVEVADEATPVVRGVVYNEDTNSPMLTPEAEEEMDSETYNLVYKAIQNKSSKIAEVFKSKSNTKETPELKQEIEKALGEAEALFKAQLKEKEDALEKALQEIQSLKVEKIEKQREDALSFVADEAKRKELVKSLASVDEVAFSVIVKAMAEQAKVEEESVLLKQMSVSMVRSEEHKDNSFDALMKAKYGVK